MKCSASSRILINHCLFYIVNVVACRLCYNFEFACASSLTSGKRLSPSSEGYGFDSCQGLIMTGLIRDWLAWYVTGWLDTELTGLIRDWLAWYVTDWLDTGQTGLIRARIQLPFKIIFRDNKGYTTIVQGNPKTKKYFYCIGFLKTFFGRTIITAWHWKTQLNNYTVATVSGKRTGFIFLLL